MTTATPLPLPADDGLAERGAPQIQSVVRALAIVEALAQARRPMALSELCSQTELKPSTAHHLLGTLVARGWVRHDLRTRHYALGGRLGELSLLIPVAGDELMAAARPAVLHLAEQSGEAVHLATMRGFELVTLMKVEWTQAVRVDTGAVGKSQAAHATATGKAVIATWPASQLDELLARHPLRRFTGRTLTDPQRLRSHLRRVQRTGFADDLEEFQPGVRCIGAPVLGADGQARAAVSCSMPTMRADRRNTASVRLLLQACVDTISKQLGHHPEPASPIANPEARETLTKETA